MIAIPNTRFFTLSMFEFLFKRKNPGPNAEREASPQASPEPKKAQGGREAPASEEARARQQEKKQAALQQAAALTDEAAALAFLLESEFADARLAAAEHVQSRAALQQALAKMRNTDRRVAKLLQQRLEALQYRAQLEERAAHCVEQAEKLLQDEKLLPNHLSELERSWMALGRLPDDLPQLLRFEQLKEQLLQRLQGQAGLQRRVLDLVVAMREAGDDTARIGSVLQEFDGIAASPENQSLPRNLWQQAQQLAEELRKRQDEVAAAQAALQACRTALQGWQQQLSQAQAAVQQAAAQAAMLAASAETAAAAETAAPEHEAAPTSEATAQREAAVNGDGEDAAATSVAESSATEAVTETTAITETTTAAPSPAPAPVIPALESFFPSRQVWQQEWRTLLQTCPAAVRDVLQQEFQQLLDQVFPPRADKVRKSDEPRAERKPEAAAEHAHATGSGQTPPKAHSNEHGKEHERTSGGKGGERHALNPAELNRAKEEFSAALSAFEAALVEGSLHDAFEQDRRLRELKQVKPGPSQAQRLVVARAELHRLQSWARWGGKVSREELVKAVEDLQGSDLPVAELAKKVGSMRERWRALDAASGPANRSQWEKFDAACTAAYAPAAAHFKKLSEERAQHAQQAQQLIDSIRTFAVQALEGEGARDWRAIAIFCQKVDQQWHRLGTIERKERKRLERDYKEWMARLETPLDAERSKEVAKREQLITEVEALDAHERGALEQLRRLQEQWQELARALPLARKVEQDLWQRFHARCEQVFAKKKENAQHEQQERRSHLQHKEALCARLEQQAAAAEADAKTLREALNQARQEWRDIGFVPRNQEQALENRWHKAQDAIQHRLQQLAQQVQQAQQQALWQRLALCQQLEAQLLAGSEEAADLWDARWQALPPLSKGTQEAARVLQTRWQQALQACADTGAGDRLRQSAARNQDALAEGVLRQEIVHGIDSPPELARQRLALQVQVLQTSLKAGRQHSGPQAALQLLALCSNPDTALQARLLRVLQRANLGGDRAQ